MSRHDPYRNFRFRLEIDGLTTAGFSEVSFGGSSVDAIDYREGTDPPYVRKLSGLTKHGNITLKRGMTKSTELFNWFRDVSTGQNARRNVAIIVADEAGTEQARFVVSQAWPAKYDVSDLNAKTAEVLIESLELVNEGFERAA